MTDTFQHHCTCGHHVALPADKAAECAVCGNPIQPQSSPTPVATISYASPLLDQMSTGEWIVRDTPLAAILLVLIPQTFRMLLLSLHATSFLIIAVVELTSLSSGEFIVVANVVLAVMYVTTMAIRIFAGYRCMRLFTILVSIDIGLGVATLVWLLYWGLSAEWRSNSHLSDFILACYAIATCIVAGLTLQSLHEHLQRPVGPHAIAPPVPLNSETAPKDSQSLPPLALAYAGPRLEIPKPAVPRERDTPLGMILLVVIPQGPRTVLFLLPAAGVMLQTFGRGEMPAASGWIILGNVLIGPAYMLTLVLRLVGFIRGRSALDGLAVMDIFLAVMTCLWPFYDRVTSPRGGSSGGFLLIVSAYAVFTALFALAILQHARHLPRKAGEPE